MQNLLFLALVIGCWRTTSGLDACASSPCTVGTCVSQRNGYSCTCAQGYSGRNCESQIDYCQPNPCRHNATCRQYRGSVCGGYYCQCPHRYYTGKLCENVIDICASSPCVSGTCLAIGVDVYKCVCPPGWNGSSCEQKIPGCLANICQNGGTCAEGVSDNMWYCICPPRYTGQRCESAVNDCSSHPCQNGAKCCEKGGAYTCECLQGFTGRLCETNITACDSNPCKNSGTCVPTGDSYNCRCLLGWFGKNCDKGACSLMPGLCLNGGMCRVRQGDMLYCTCPYGYTGNRCEKSIYSTTPITTSVSTSTSSTSTTSTSTTSTSTATTSASPTVPTPGGAITTSLTSAPSTTSRTSTSTITPSTTVVSTVSASSSVLNDTVVRVYVLRRALNGLPYMCGRLAHSGLLLKTRSGKMYVVEYMDDGRSHKYPAVYTVKAGVTHPAGATYIQMRDDSGTLHDWTKQNKGTPMPKDVNVTPDEAQKQMQKIMGTDYHLLKNNCHAAQELLRRTWGLKVQKKREVVRANGPYINSRHQDQWGIEEYLGFRAE